MMPKYEAEDKYILKVEKIVVTNNRSHPEEAGSFCLGAYVVAEPTNADSAYAKKLTDNRLGIGDNGGMLTCPTEGCEVILADDLKMASGGCPLASFCLKQAWDDWDKDDEETHKAYDKTVQASELSGDSHSLGYKCPNPLCGFSAGWGEDGTGGTSGCCAKE